MGDNPMNIENNEKKYNHGNKMVYSCQYHVIFVTKYRKPLLQNDETQKRCKELLQILAKERNFIIHEVEVMPDHVHAIVDVNPRFGICRTISLMKGITSFNLRKEFSSIKSRSPCMWTGGYFVSTVGSVSLETVKKYILEQKIREK